MKNKQETFKALQDADILLTSVGLIASVYSKKQDDWVSLEAFVDELNEEGEDDELTK